MNHVIESIKAPNTDAHANTLKVVCMSDKGLVRLENEDNFACDRDSGLLVLADGMGGGPTGEVASAIAVSTVMRELRKNSPVASKSEQPNNGALNPLMTALCNAVSKANREILDVSLQESRHAGMGTTLLVAWFTGERLMVANVGDSRLYLLRDNTLMQITVDHTLLQEQLELGYLPRDDAHRVAARSTLTRAVGTEPNVTVDIFEQSVCAGDIVLLCSDGLYDMLEDVEIRSVLIRTGQDIDLAAQELIREAIARGGVDNVTVMLAKH